MDTKAKILDSAEALFADEGFASTSMRDITARAGVNLAAVNYHFGSKLELLKAVFSRRFGPVNEERLAELDALDEPDVERVLRAFFTPVFQRLREPGSGWMKFMQLVGRTHSDTNDEIRRCLMEQVEVVATRFTAALAEALPQLPPAVLVSRIHFVVGAMAHTFAFCRQRELPLVEALPDPDAVLENLVQFSLAGLKAPVGSLISLEDA